MGLQVCPLVFAVNTLNTCEDRVFFCSNNLLQVLFGFGNFLQVPVSYNFHQSPIVPLTVLACSAFVSAVLQRFSRSSPRTVALCWTVSGPSPELSVFFLYFSVFFLSVFCFDSVFSIRVFPLPPCVGVGLSGYSLWGEVNICV